MTSPTTKPTAGEPAGALARVFTPRHVLLDVETGSKKRLFEQIGLALENANRLGMGQVFDSLFARERLGSTGIGKGVAIPHGRLAGLKEAAGFFVRLKSPIAWDAPDNLPVSMLFVLLMPEQANNQHLTLLAELAERFNQPQLREALLAAPDADAAYALLTAPAGN